MPCYTDCEESKLDGVLLQAETYTLMGGEWVVSHPASHALSNDLCGMY